MEKDIKYVQIVPLRLSLNAIWLSRPHKNNLKFSIHIHDWRKHWWPSNWESDLHSWIWSYWIQSNKNSICPFSRSFLIRVLSNGDCEVYVEIWKLLWGSFSLFLAFWSLTNQTASWGIIRYFVEIMSLWEEAALFNGYVD